MILRFLPAILLVISNSIFAFNGDSSKQFLSFSFGRYYPSYLTDIPESPYYVNNESRQFNNKGIYFELNFRRKNLGVTLGFQSSGRHYELDYLNAPYWYSIRTEKHTVIMNSWKFELSGKLVDTKIIRAFAFGNIQIARIADIVYKEPVADSAYYLYREYMKNYYHPTHSRPYFGIGIQTEINLFKQTLYLQNKISYTSQLSFQNGSNSERHFALSAGFNLILSELLNKKGAFLNATSAK